MAAYNSLPSWIQSGLPSLINNLRYYPPERLQQFYDEFMKTSASLESLRKLHRLLHCSHSRLLPEEVVIALVATLCDCSLPSTVHSLCIHILLESFPNDSLRFQDLQQIPIALPSLNILELLLSCRGKGKHYSVNEHLEFQKKIICQIISKEEKIENKLQALRILAQSNLCPTDDEIEGLVRHLTMFLCSEVFSSPMPIPKPVRFKGITEIDGIPALQFVTVLNLVDVPCQTHQLNVQTFSIIHQVWDSLFNKRIASSAFHHTLQTKTVDYCLRIIEQAEKKPLSPLDLNFQQAALIEALRLLHDVCKVDPLPIIRILPTIRRIHDQANSLELALPALQFLIDYGQHIAYDSAHELEVLFDTRIIHACKNLCSSCEAVYFLTTNLEKFHSMTSRPLQQWYPNIFKLVAWFPITFASEFMEFLPAFMSPSTAIEVLHCLLDLPCQTAAMICTMDETRMISPRLLHNINTSTSKALLNFALRIKSGSGETLERLDLLHSLLQDLQSHSRVTASANVVVPLLEIYFDVISDCSDEALSIRLLPVMLERANYMFTVPELVENVQRIFAKEVLKLLQRHPYLVAKASLEIGNFVCNAKDPCNELCTNLIWGIGQYTSLVNCSEATMELIRNYYDILECVAYEHLTCLLPRTVSITVASMVKLASRCQDLVPRVLLCLSKVNQFAKSSESYEWKAVISRLEEFVALLNEPNVAATTLTPSKESLSGRHHCDNATLPVMWRAASALVLISPTMH